MAKNTDLPLLANTDEVIVDHYVLHLDADFSQKIFRCEVFLFLRPGICKRNTSQIVLDCKHLVVCSVDALTLNSPELTNCFVPSYIASSSCRSNALRVAALNELDLVFQDPNKSVHKPLKFSVKEWCLKIWNEPSVNETVETCIASQETASSENAHSPTDCNRLRDDALPSIIRIRYHTSAMGTSVIWRKDKRGRDCCFTPGSSINNRALFPCQEPPIAMATWEAFIKVPAGANVVLSSDSNPIELERDKSEMLTSADHDHVTYYGSSVRMQLPMSTLALAIGYLSSSQVPNRLAPVCKTKEVTSGIQCRLLALESETLNSIKEEFSSYIHQYLDSAIELLGPYPFLRLDLLVMPRCFDCLGLASPNVIFLSQSVLAGDGSMLPYIAHEIAHSWFGLAIGASDWSEEWLSEGFATYIGDIVHSRAMKWSAQKSMEWCELRAFLHYRTLASEIENTQSDLQTLNPSQMKHDESTAKKSEDPTTTKDCFVKNGLRPEKAFMQVHYLKGFFLLRYLADLIGHQEFNAFLRKYAETYHGLLVDSQDVFKLLFEHFPGVSLKGITMASLYEDWLDNPGLPKALAKYQPSTSNSLYNEILIHVEWWKRHNRRCTRAGRHGKKLKWDYGELIPFGVADQLVLLMELLLDVPRISKSTLRSLNEHYELHKQNANVRHRWCELIIKHNYEPGLGEVETFLLEDQGMGVYLYGELLMSSCKNFHKMASTCWSRVKNEMGDSLHRVVTEMFLQDEHLIADQVS